MKSQMQSILFAVLVSACGSDRGVSVDPLSFMPQLPAVQQPAVVAPAPEPVKVAIVEPHVMPTKFDDAMAQGRELAAKNDRAGAREMFEAAIKLDKKRAEPHLELAKMFITSGDRGLAIAAANKAVKLVPLSSAAWNTKGRAELNRFAYDDAIEAFTKSVELNPDNVWAWNNLGYTELQLKKYDAAVAHLTEATSRAGATGFMFNNLGTALEQLDRLDDARTAFESGGKLGSVEAAKSRKRLDGVESIAAATPVPAVTPKAEPKAKTFDNDEGTSPEPVEKPDPAGTGSAGDTGGDEEGSDAGVTKSTM